MRTLPPMTQADPSRLCFEGTVIDFTGRRLLRDGRERPLEPKAFGVLALLAASPGQVFSRDQILDAVWGHRHVTPGVLNRVVTLLRQALDEDAQHPRLLHTVHGVGYRFDLPATGPAGDAGQAASTAPAAPADPVAGSIPAPRRRARTAIVAVALLGLLAFAAWRMWPAGHDVPATSPGPATGTVASHPPSLAVVPLKAIDQDEGTRVIADGLSEELIGSLARIEGMRVIARTSSFMAAAESSDPVQLARRLGVTHLLEGSLQRDGEQLRARLRLLDAQGRALWARDFDRDATEVLLLQREIAQAVATSLALRLALAPRPVTGGDAEFLRRYHAALALVDIRAPAERSVELAEGEFRALLRERPEDARAHAGLALALEVRAQRKPTLGPGLRAEALREADIATGLDPDLPQPYFVRGYSACMRGEWQRCVEQMDEVRRLSPGESNASVPLATAMSRLGYLDRAETVLREFAERDPLNPGAHFLLGRLLDTLGRHEEARAELARTDLSGAYARWFNAFWRHDHDEALRIAESEIGSPGFPDPSGVRYAPGYIAAAHALRDPALWPEALARFEQAERNSGLWNFARVLAPDAPRHAPEYIRQLVGIRQRGYSSWDLLLWTRDLAWLRRDPAFQDYLRSSGTLDYWRVHGFPGQCRPQGDGAACD